MMYSLKKAASIMNARGTGKIDQEISLVGLDSRKMQRPGETLFFAISGPYHDGHEYIPDLYRQGTRAFVVERLPGDLQPYPGAGFLVVKNTVKALHALAASHRNKFTFPVWAITGSNGKTIVKEWLARCLQADYRVMRSPKSYNSQVGVPLSLLLMEPVHEMAIIEAGISKPGEMEKLQSMIQPDIGFFTMIGDAHQENFKNLQEKIDEKLALFTSCQKIYHAMDQAMVHQRVTELYRDKRLPCWSREDGQADLFVKDIQKGVSETVMLGIFQGNAVETRIPFSDKASIDNALLVWLALLDMGIPAREIQYRMKHLPPVAMRLEYKKGVNGCTILNDSYNSDINSLGIALDFLFQQEKHKRKTLVLSDILQSGRDEKELYQEVAKLVSDSGVDRFIGIGYKLQSHAALFGTNSQFFTGTGSFLANMDQDVFRNEAILVKGARVFGFERISKFLEQQAHQTVLEIDLNALIHNLNYFQSRLSPETKIMVMVKAFSYGSGLHEVANLLQYHRVDYLGVAFVDEGGQLRDNGIQIPIMVMQPEERSFDAMVQYGLEPEVYSMDFLTLFTNYLKEKDIYAYPVHLKFNTGMNRLGFEPEERGMVIGKIKHEGRLQVKSVFSHLAASDEPRHDEFTRGQIKQFQEIRASFQQAFSRGILYHILNSAGIERFPEAAMDMVRLGIGMYGVSALKYSPVQPISTFKSTIIQVKKVSPPDTVGYGRKGILPGEREIAVVPIGYADGLDRKLSNGKGAFLVRGKKAPIIGKVCMDVTMADVTGLGAKEGDEAILFGQGQTINDLANTLGTIPYEILTSVSNRVKRVYVQE